MDPLDKLDLILNSIIKTKKKEFEGQVAKGRHPADVYLVGVHKQIDALEEALSFIRQIKRKTPEMADEVVLKMYGSK